MSDLVAICQVSAGTARRLRTAACAAQSGGTSKNCWLVVGRASSYADGYLRGRGNMRGARPASGSPEMAGHSNIMGLVWQCRQTTEGSAHHLCCDLIKTAT